MKEYAIKDHHLFVKAYQKGKKIRKRNITVFVLPDYHASRLRNENPEKKTINRLGFSVSKRNGGAVLRNRAKRIMREGYRAVIRERPIKTGFLIVILAGDSCATSSSTEIKSELTSAFAALNLFRGQGPVFPKGETKENPSKKPKKHQGHPFAVSPSDASC